MASSASALSVSLPTSFDVSLFSSVPVVETNALVSSVVCEPCGYLYERRRQVLETIERGLLDAVASRASHRDPADASSATGGSPGGGGAANASTYRRDGKQKVVKLSEQDLEVDWYDVLKLPNAEGSSEEQVRTAYRRRCLETHPDKQPDKTDEAFKRVQRAFEILGDADARRAYDCSRPFDDNIPPEEVAPESFYKVFAPVFERNKKWSIHPLPSLGDENTTIKQVQRFYDAWMLMQSWRDFSHEAELDEIDESMCREEKRYYQRENERQLNFLRRQESKRVRSLVERAMKCDPRLRKQREEEAARREQERSEREAERRRLREEEERRRAEVAEKDRLVQEARRREIVEARDKIKLASQRVTSFLTTHRLLDTTSTNLLLPNLVRPPNVQWFFSKATVEEAVAMESAVTEASVESADGTSVPCVTRFNECILAKEQRIGVTRYGEPVKRDGAASGASQGGPSTSAAGGAAASDKRKTVVWSEDDVTLLQKAIAKFPGGTVDRWRRIAVMMREKFSEEEVLAKTKELEAALKSASTKTTTAAPPTTPGGGASSSAAATNAGGSALPAGGAVGGGSATASSVAAPAAAAGAAPSSGVEDWTVKQQKQLEQGLRELKDYKEKDKFQKVATFVEGKTAKQCFERFKYLCSLTKK